MPPDCGWRIPRRILFPLTAICGLAVFAAALAAQLDAQAIGDALMLLLRAWYKNRAGWPAFARVLPLHGRAVLVAAAIILAAGMAGGRGLAWLGARASSLRGGELLITRIGLGLGVWSLAVMALALAGVMHPVVLFALGAGMIVAGAAPLGGSPREAGNTGARGWGWAAIWTASGLLLATDFAASLCPEWFSDGQMYHLGLPERFLLDRKFAPMPENLLTFLPLNTEMIYGVALAFGGEEAAKVLNWGWGALVAVAAAALARRLGGGRTPTWTSALAALLVVSLPVTMIENEISFGDNFRALTETLALIWAVRAVRGSRVAVVAAGVFAGIAMGSKYLSVERGALIAAGLAAFGVAGTRRPAATAGFVAVASFVLAPWLCRNWLIGGDPVYPFVQSVFTPLRFTPGELARWMQDNAHYGVLGQTTASWAGTFLRASVSPGDNEFGTFALSPLLLGFLPLLLGMRRWPAAAFLVLAVAAGEGLFWSLSSHLIRYLLPALVAACALNGWLIARVDADSRRFSRLLAAIVLLWTLPVMVMRAHHRFNLDDVFGTFAYTTGRNTYADRLGPRGFGAVTLRLPAGCVLMVGEDRVLGLGRRWRAGSIYDPMLVKEWAEESRTTRRFEIKARQAGIGSVILYGDGFRASQDRGPEFRLNDRELAVLNPWWRRLAVVYRCGGWTGYAVGGGRRAAKGLTGG